MKFVFLLPQASLSGGLFVAYRHAHFLAARGHDVTMAFIAESGGLGVHAYPNFTLPVRGLAELVKSREHFDVVISGWWECYYEMFRIPADHYLHFVQGDDRESLDVQYGGAFPDQPFVEFAFTNPRVGYLTVARWLKKRLETDADITVAYAPNGIDLSHFHPDVTPLEPRGERPRILIEGPGGLAFKRVDLAFRVARQIPEADIWHVSSDGIVQKDWRSQRRFTEVPLRDMPSLYASSDILLKLSVVEGFFGPPLEMMACGGTAVVSRVHGHEEYVVDGHNALTVPLDDEAAAVDAVRRLVADASFRRELSANAVETSKQFAWDRQCPKFEAGVMDLVGRLPSWGRGERAAQVAFAELRARVSGGHPLSRRKRRRIGRAIVDLLRRPAGWLASVPRLIRSAQRRLAGRAAPMARNKSRQEVSTSGPRRRSRADRLGPAVFVGQREYFRAAYFDGVHRGHHFEFSISSANPAEQLRTLPDFIRAHGIRSCIVFRPEWLATCPGLVEQLQSDGVWVIGYSTEPIPTSAATKWHLDQRTRLESLRQALPLPLDLLIHYDPASESFLRRLGFGRLICHPLPVSETLFHPEEMPLEFDACFLGRSTQHRERMLGPLKSQMAIVHVAHGLVDEQARAFMNRSRVVLNIHCEPYPNFETRVVQALRCNRPVVSEPLPGPFLTPGVDYRVASTPHEFLTAVQGVSASHEEFCRNGQRTDLKMFALDTLLTRIANELGCRLGAAHDGA